jgi:hypothetical protein
MLAAGDHANIMSRKRQFDREIAADSAGTKDTDLHRFAHVLTGESARHCCSGIAEISALRQ